jgi:hypothetical protein
VTLAILLKAQGVDLNQCHWSATLTISADDLAQLSRVV